MERRLAAIVVADVVGFSRMVAEDETGTIERMRELRDNVTEPAIEKAGGRIFKRTGDGTLVEFSSVTAAIEGAIDVQRRLAMHAERGRVDQKLCAVKQTGKILLAGRLHRGAIGGLSLLGRRRMAPRRHAARWHRPQGHLRLHG